MKRCILTAALAIALAVLCQPALARNAGLLLSPTRLVLDHGQRFATVTLRNNGDGVGRYVIEMVDATMAENGGIKILDPGVKAPDSALDIISFSPHSVTLKPDDYQTIRILVKSMSDLPDGEYRSHLEVRMTQADLKDDEIKPDPQQTVIVPRALLSTVIPVIVRKGNTHFALTIDDAKVTMSPVPQLELAMSFSGNCSVIGDIRVTDKAPDGKVVQLAYYRGVAIYRDVAHRTQPVPLDIPKGFNIRQGTIDVAFMSQDDHNPKVLAEKTVAAR